MRKMFIAGNWKMNGSKVQAQELLAGLYDNLADQTGQIDCVVCPAAPYLDVVSAIIKSYDKKTIELGAQNITSQNIAAYTGEISPMMLGEFGVKYVIIGHSERRKLLHETDFLVAEKVDVTLDAKLVPILCVGETQEEQAAGFGFAVVARQLQAVLGDVCVAELSEAVIAYEPVWAIGTGLSATPEQAQNMHAHIRKLIAEYDVAIAEKIRIIYGGSVNSANAKQLLEQPDIDGCLVGGASLKHQEFSDICHIAMGIRK